MRASKADKFYMGMLLAIICFCFGLLRIMDEADARRAAERETLIIVEPPTIVVPASQPVQSRLPHLLKGAVGGWLLVCQRLTLPCWCLQGSHDRRRRRRHPPPGNRPG